MRNSVNLLLMVGLAGQLCGAFWLPSWLSPRCNDEVYDSDSHVCCMDKLQQKPFDWLKMECCLERMYNTMTHHCCIDGLSDSGPLRAELARKVPGETRERGCSRALKRPPTAD